ncbi:hypothetical protein GVN20_05340 [Runella sp. CRIBMP]|uniref:hypothetical protein n=1 Tax=Runella sp. CRIBMP TaxID=2683261 RepID=UPI0014135AA6|nr:hypothetical protein [Runella sp. CRIBMP]NBB18775.1 hypothetical protein [Runella sp. CRIBMP]
MKTLDILSLLTLSVLVACTTQGSEGTAANNEGVEMTSNCYMYTSKKDTIQMNLLRLGNKVSGDLAYKLYEKDLNQGTIEGEVRGDTLLVNYIFNSEGTNSIRQIVFLKQGDNWVEGYGDIEVTDEKVNFKNPKALNFNSTLILKKATCGK